VQASRVRVRARIEPLSRSRLTEVIDRPSYDDSRFGRIPGLDLTSVRQDIPKMARSAVKAVVDRLDRPTRKPKDLVLKPKLVVRGTTSASPRATTQTG
jgi:DNA-binding LacI/PurR family transcriptional regulator